MLSRELSFHVIKMKSVLKIMNQLQRDVPPPPQKKKKTAVHDRHSTCSSTGNEPYLVANTVIVARTRNIFVYLASYFSQRI